jgi:hypothetical protein
MQPIYSDCDNIRKREVGNQKYKSQETQDCEVIEKRTPTCFAHPSYAAGLTHLAVVDAG